MALGKPTMVPLAAPDEFTDFEDIWRYLDDLSRASNTMFEDIINYIQSPSASSTIQEHTHQNTENGGILDHGLALTGLNDDDHTQYLKEKNSGGLALEVPNHNHQNDDNCSKLDHGLALTGLADDDHTQYLNDIRHDTTDRHGSTVVDHGLIGGLTDDDHTQYLNTARHDTADRHPILQNLLTNSSFGVWSALDAVNIGNAIYVTSHTTGNNTVIAYTSNTQGLAVGKQVKFTEGDASLRTCLHTITDLTANTWFKFNLEGNKVAAGGGTAVAYEAAPGYTTVPGANGDACDEWSKSLSLSVWRMPASAVGGGLSSGSPWAIAAYKRTTDEEIIYWEKMKDKEPGYVYKVAGRKVTFGAVVYPAQANKIRLSIYDGVTTTYSSYAPLANTKQWLEVSTTIGNFNSIDRIRVAFHFEGSVGDLSYITAPMLVLGSYIGEFNYQSIPGEIVRCKTHITPVTYYGATVGAGDNRFIRICDETNGAVPRGAIGVVAAFEGTAGSAGSQSTLCLYRNSTAPQTQGIILLAAVNGTKVCGGHSLIQINNGIEDTLWVESTSGANMDWTLVSIDISHVVMP